MKNEQSLLAAAAKACSLILLAGMLTACPQLQQGLNSFMAAPPPATEEPGAASKPPVDSLVPTDGTVNATNGVVGELGAEVPQEPSVLEGAPPSAEEIPQP